MKFAELKKTLKQSVLPVYLLSGNDQFLITRSYELILQTCNITMPEMNTSIFNEDDVDFEIVVKSLNTMPFFEDKRFVYVSLINKANNNVKNVNALTEYLKNPNSFSVLVINCGAEIKDYLKNIVKSVEVVDCNKLEKPLVLSFVKSEIKKYNKTFSQLGLEVLFEFTNGDLSKMNQELTKLVSYVGDRSEINENDIKLICVKSVEFQIYELTNALAKKNGEKVFEILNVLKSKKDEMRGVLGLIHNAFRRLLFVAITNEPNKKLSELLGIQEYAVAKNKEQASLFSKKALKEINDICMDIDYQIKNSQISVNSAVDYLVLKILNIK